MTDVVWIAELGIHYKLALTGLNLFLLALTTLLFAVAIFASTLRTWERPQALLLQHDARRVGGPGGLPVPGSGPVRGLLRPDADPVLLPDGRLGTRTGTGAGDDQARHLHARGLAADARGRGRPRRDRLRAQRPPHHLRAHLAADDGPAGGLTGLDLPLLRRRLPGEDARLPAARVDARRLPGDADRGADGVLGGALEGRRLRLPGDRAAADAARLLPLPDADAPDRAGLDPVRVRAGLQPDRRAADRRLLVGRPARLHHARDLRPERPGRPGGAAADGQPRPRRRPPCCSSCCCSHAVPEARRTSARWAASPSAHRCSRACS